MCIKPFAHFKLGRLSFCCLIVRVLYIQDTRPLLELWFANIFFHHLYCFFTFSMSFDAQNFSNLIKYSLSVFLLLLMILMSCQKSHYQIQGHKHWLLWFSHVLILNLFLLFLVSAAESLDDQFETIILFSCKHWMLYEFPSKHRFTCILQILFSRSFVYIFWYFIWFMGFRT